MIKSDRWIKRMSRIEAFTVEVNERYTENRNRYLVTEDTVEKVMDGIIPENIIRDVKRKFSQIELDNNLIFTLKNSIIKVFKNRESTLPMIEPFFSESIKVNSIGEKIPSFGVSSFGYDVRLDTTIKLFKQRTSSHDIVAAILRDPDQNELNTTSFLGIPATSNAVLDPSNFYKDSYTEFKNVKEIVVPPRGFLLGNTMEYFRMPKRVMGMCIGKSTWARCGLHPLVTPLEPGWEGYLTLEFANLTDLPIRVQTGVGVAQINFFESDEDCDVTYADRGGKYQDQGREPVDPKV